MGKISYLVAILEDLVAGQHVRRHFCQAGMDL
jgi:hypothetical protein